MALLLVASLVAGAIGLWFQPAQPEAEAGNEVVNFALSVSAALMHAVVGALAGWMLALVVGWNRSRLAVIGTLIGVALFLVAAWTW